MKLLFLFICIYSAEALYINFFPNNLTLLLDETLEINYTLSDSESDISLSSNFIIYSDNENVVTLSEQIILNPSLNSSGSFSIHGKFIGRSSILCKDNQTNQNVEGRIDVRVLREQSIVDTIFVATVATLVCIIYVNFGCAVDWNEPKKIIKKPIGPVIGFAGQFILMPLLSYGLGLLIFPNNPEMRLGMFFVGCSPAGGASNVWTALLEGNINLSVMMTAISTFAAFGMMPLWIFTLGKIIFKDANLEVPYSQITTYVVSLVLPLALGYLIQRYFKKVAAFMTKIMKGLASLLIIVIIVFATATNVYLFKIFSWEIVISGLALPWLAYVTGFLVAVALKQPIADCIAIAVEIGIQNTGISIFLLRVALPQPEADLTTVVPVANAILTPVPLGIALVCTLIRKRIRSRSKVDITNMKSVELS